MPQTRPYKVRLRHPDGKISVRIVECRTPEQAARKVHANGSKVVSVIKVTREEVLKLGDERFQRLLQPGKGGSVP